MRSERRGGATTSTDACAGTTGCAPSGGQRRPQSSVADTPAGGRGTSTPPPGASASACTCRAQTAPRQPIAMLCPWGVLDRLSRIHRALRQESVGHAPGECWTCCHEYTRLCARKVWAMLRRVDAAVTHPSIYNWITPKNPNPKPPQMDGGIKQPQLYPRRAGSLPAAALAKLRRRRRCSQAPQSSPQSLCRPPPAARTGWSPGWRRPPPRCSPLPWQQPEMLLFQLRMRPQLTAMTRST